MVKSRYKNQELALIRVDYTLVGHPVWRLFLSI